MKTILIILGALLVIGTIGFRLFVRALWEAHREDDDNNFTG
jgi:hypothetical protein